MYHIAKVWIQLIYHVTIRSPKWVGVFLIATTTWTTSSGQESVLDLIVISDIPYSFN